MKEVRSAYPDNVSWLEKTIFMFLLKFTFVELAVTYLMWKRKHDWLGGFLTGYFGNKKRNEGLDEDDFAWLDIMYTKFFSLGKFLIAANIGNLIDPAHYPRSCYEKALEAGEYLQAHSIASKFCSKAEVEAARQAWNEFATAEGLLDGPVIKKRDDDTVYH